MANLPFYLQAAKPVPLANRAPWYKTIAPAYIGVMLWFVFWQDLVTCGTGKYVHSGGVIANGFFYPFLGLTIAAVICHFLFYLVPGLLGMRTGLPLYVVGTSTYGARGGLFMPGLLMGLLQFGWLAVNSFMVAKILCKCFNVGMTPDALEATVPSWPHGIIAASFAILAAFIGLKGIKYMARVATYLPLIPVLVLLVLLAITCTGLGSFNLNMLKLPAPATPECATPWSDWQIVAILCVYIVGFFATAGAAGVDIASNSRSVEDVHTGGVTGILLPTVLAGWVVMFIIAGAYGGGMVQHAGNYNPVELDARHLRGEIGPRVGPQDRQYRLDRSGHRLAAGGLLLVHDRCQQLQDHHAQGQPVHLRRHRHAGGGGPGGHGRRRPSDLGLPSDRGLLRARLRRDDGRLLPVRPEMVRAKSRIQSGRLDLLDRRLCRRGLQSRS